MPANQNPLFTLTPQIWSNIVTGNNPSRGSFFGSTGQYFTVASGANFGSRIDFLRVVGTGTNTAGILRLFIDNSKTVPNNYSNTGIYLFQEVSLSAVTPSTTVICANSEVVRNDGRAICILPSGVILSATASVQDVGNNFVVTAHGGDF